MEISPNSPDDVRGSSGHRGTCRATQRVGFSPGWLTGGSLTDGVGANNQNPVVVGRAGTSTRIPAVFGGSPRASGSQILGGSTNAPPAGTQSPHHPPPATQPSRHPLLATQSPESHTASTSTPPTVSSYTGERQLKGRGRGKGAQPPSNPTKKKKIWINAKGNFSHGVVRRTISSNMKNLLTEFAPKFVKLSVDGKATLWRAFTDTFQWDEAHTRRIVQLYTRESKYAWSHEVGRARTNYLLGLENPAHLVQHPLWIRPMVLPHFIAYWGTPEFDNRSKKAKLNRSKGPKKMYFGQSVNVDVHREKLAIEKNCEPNDVPILDVWTKTHGVIGPDDKISWTNERAGKGCEAYRQRCIREKGENEKDWPPLNREWWLEAFGPIKKNRVPGVPIAADPEYGGYQVRQELLYIGLSSESSPTHELREIIQTQAEEIITLKTSHSELRSEMMDIVGSLRDQITSIQGQSTMHSTQYTANSTFPSAPLGTNGLVMQQQQQYQQQQQPYQQQQQSYQQMQHPNQQQQPYQQQQQPYQQQQQQLQQQQPNQQQQQQQTYQQLQQQQQQPNQHQQQPYQHQQQQQPVVEEIQGLNLELLRVFIRQQPDQPQYSS